MITSVFRTLKLTKRLFYPSLGHKIRTKKRVNTINLLSWKSLLSVLSIFNSLFSYTSFAADWLKKQQQKNLSRKNRLVSFVLPAPVTVELYSVNGYKEKKEAKQ